MRSQNKNTLLAGASVGDCSLQITE